MERFAQFVSQLLLSALTEVMRDTAITSATVCVRDRISVCAHTHGVTENATTVTPAIMQMAYFAFVITDKQNLVRIKQGLTD